MVFVSVGRSPSVHNRPRSRCGKDAITLRDLWRNISNRVKRCRAVGFMCLKGITCQPSPGSDGGYYSIKKISWRYIQAVRSPGVKSVPRESPVKTEESSEANSKPDVNSQVLSGSNIHLKLCTDIKRAVLVFLILDVQILVSNTNPKTTGHTPCSVWGWRAEPKQPQHWHWPFYLSQRMHIIDRVCS